MSKALDGRTPEAAQAGFNRRTFISLAPAAAIASSVSKIEVPGSENRSLYSANIINDALATLWDQTAFVSPSVVRVSSAAAIDAHVYGGSVGLIPCSRPEFAQRGEGRDKLAARYGGFGLIRVEAHLSARQGLETRNWLEKWSLLLGGRRPDDGSLKAFLRAEGALCGQRVALYKPPDDSNAYLIGTRDGVVPRRRQVVCIGEFTAAQLPNYIRLLRHGGDQVKVESMKFPIPPSFFSRRWSEW